MFWGNRFVVTTIYMFDFKHSFSYLVMHMHMFIQQYLCICRFGNSSNNFVHSFGFSNVVIFQFSIFYVYVDSVIQYTQA